MLVGYNGRGNRNHSQMQFRAELGRFAAEFAAFAVGRAGARADLASMRPPQSQIPEALRRIAFFSSAERLEVLKKWMS